MDLFCTISDKYADNIEMVQKRSMKEYLRGWGWVPPPQVPRLLGAYHPTSIQTHGPMAKLTQAQSRSPDYHASLILGGGRRGSWWSRLHDAGLNGVRHWLMVADLLAVDCGEVVRVSRDRRKWATTSLCWVGKALPAVAMFPWPDQLTRSTNTYIKNTIYINQIPACSSRTCWSTIDGEPHRIRSVYYTRGWRSPCSEWCCHDIWHVMSVPSHWR